MEEAAKQLADVSSELAYDVNEQSIISGVTGASVFAGIAGAGIAGLYGASRDLVLGFATVGATGYAINSLYANRTYGGIFASGLDAITCVQAASGPALDAHRKWVAQWAAVESASASVKSRLDLVKKNIPPPQADRANDAVNTATQTTQLMRLRVAAETEYAGQISGSIQNILRTINSQITATLPDAAAIMRAASGIGTAALGALPGTRIVKTEEKEAAHRRAYALLNVEEINRLDPELETDINILVSSTDAIAETLRTPSPPINSQGCSVADLPTTAPMSTDAPAAVDIKYGNPALAYKISGGNGAYSAHWTGTEPPDVMAAMQGDTLRIFVTPGLEKSKFTPGKSYTLDVYDSSPGGGKHLPSPIAVNTKPDK